MKPSQPLSVFAALCVVTLACAADAAIPANIAAAIADSHRPAAERAQDANRKPGTVLAFAGVRTGEKVVDLMPGSGYYTRIFSAAVGAKGKVYALQPAEMDKEAPKGLISLHTFAGMAPYANVTVLVQPVAAIKLPEKVDMVWTSQNYHDLHDGFMSKPDMVKFDRSIFDALKPGGTFLVLDHAAAAGSGTSRTEDFHRIDPAAVKAEATAAGFEFVGESDALSNPADDRSRPIFDPSIKGHTDKFIYKFRKPK